MNSGSTKFYTLFWVSLFALVMTSCLKEEDEKVYTKAEEEALRSIYLHNLEYEGVDIDTTENGVFYIVREEGEGDFVQEGDTLSVGYSGYFIDGTLFDTTIGRGDGKMSFVYGKDSFIEGWDEGMKVMNEGALVQFIIPSELAYGSMGYMAVPPYQTLVFVVELIEIKSAQENTIIE